MRIERPKGGLENIGFLIALVTAALPWVAMASPPAPYVTTDDLMREAELVFQGSVASVDYAKSISVSGQSESRPYTFVTFNVEQVFKGSCGSRLTLRFVGGPIEGDVFMRVPQLPLFDVGDRDILLVRGNGSEECPLAGCSQGRFRIVEGLVVNEIGQRLQLRDGSLKPGPAVQLAQIDSHTMGRFKLERVERGPDNRDVRQTREQALASLDPALDVSPEELPSLVRSRITRLHLPEELEQARGRSVPSLDASEPFNEPVIPDRVMVSRDGPAPTGTEEEADAVEEQTHGPQVTPPPPRLNESLASTGAPADIVTDRLEASRPVESASRSASKNQDGSTKAWLVVLVVLGLATLGLVAVRRTRTAK